MCQIKYTSLYVPKPIKFQHDEVPLGVNVRVSAAFPKALSWPKNFPFCILTVSAAVRKSGISENLSPKHPRRQRASGRWQQTDAGIERSLMRSS